MESYYIIKSKLGNKEKYYYVNETENEFEYNILVGGIKIKCVNIIIDKIRKIALLELLQHHQKCSLYSDLEKGDEVKALLINSLYYINIKYPKIKYIELIDNSFILCKNKKKISLPDLSFVKYNKTWYEKNFNAIPSNNSKFKIKNLKKLINKIINRKIKLNYEDFIKEYYASPIFQNKVAINIIKNTYIENMILKDFLDKLQEYDCVFYENIFNKLIGNLLQGTEWIIKIETIKEYNLQSEIINIEKIKGNSDLDILYKKLTNKESNKGATIYDGII